MNELKIFNTDIIPVYTTDTGEKVVKGRELHENLEIKTPYDKWFPRMCEYGFVEPNDFWTFLSESTGGRPAENHILKFDMAKHIAMIQRTDIGFRIRQKLIDLEKAISALPAAEAERLKVEAQRERAKAMLLNAQSRALKTVMGTIGDKKLSAIAVEVFGLKAIESMTGTNMGKYLPETKPTYSATEIGKRLGVSANKIGSLANKHNLKTDEYGITVMDKSRYSAKEVPTFRYYDNVVPVFEQLVKGGGM